MFYLNLLFLLFIVYGIVLGNDNDGNRKNGVYSQSTKERFAELTKKYGKNFKTSSSCGGYMEGLAGGINYYLDQQLTLPGDVCVWTIFVPKKQAIKVELLEDGFFLCSNCQDIAVLRINTTSWQMEHALTIHRDPLDPSIPDRKQYTITGGSLFQIVFVSNTWVGMNTTGFSLLFQGTGGNTAPNDTIYTVFETIGTVAGSISYSTPIPPLPAVHHHFVMFTVHPSRGKNVALTLNSHHRHYHSFATSFPWACGSNNYQTIVISDFGYHADHLAGPDIRLRECYNANYSNTVISHTPLMVAYYTSPQRPISFNLNWEMLELL